MAISPFIFNWKFSFFIKSIFFSFNLAAKTRSIYTIIHFYLWVTQGGCIEHLFRKPRSKHTSTLANQHIFQKKKSLQLDWIESFKIGISSVFINRTKFIMLLSITNDKDNNIVNNNEWRHLTILSKNNVCYFCTRVAMIRQNQLYIYRLYERTWKTITVTIITVLDSTTHTNERIQSQSAIKVQNRQRRRQTKRDFNRIRALW